MYHRIHDRGDGTGISRKNFEQQMEFIKGKMTPVSLIDIIDWLLKKKTIPQRAVAITFDDGYEDNFINGYPILRKFDIPATIFLTTGHIETTRVFWWDKVNEIIRKTKRPYINLKDFQGFAQNGYIYSPRAIMLNSGQSKIHAMKTITELFKTFEYNRINEAVALLQEIIDVEVQEISYPPMLNWRQVREMSNNGIDFGAHTVTHVNLAEAGLKEAKKEIITSKESIEEKINRSVQGFAYPYGIERHYNGTIINMVTEAGFKYACTAEKGIALPKDKLYELPRISMSNAQLPLSLWNILKHI